MKRAIELFVLFFFLRWAAAPECVASHCALKNTTGSGLAAQNTALMIWAKTCDDANPFPSWANTIPATFTDYYQVMSYNRHRITAKVATRNGGFYVSDPGHTVDYYKNLYSQSGQDYAGPWGIFVKEILAKVENDYGAAYFDDVNLIIMIITDGGPGWYQPYGNFSGIALLGTDYTTGNGKFFGRDRGGITIEFSEGEEATLWTVCHEYGHFLGLSHRTKNYGTYSLMNYAKYNEAGETVTPLAIQDIFTLGWLDFNDPARVVNITSNASVTLKPMRSTTGVVAAIINIPGTLEIFVISNHQQSTNPYDGTYPASGLLVWHMNDSSVDLKCAIALDPNVYERNFDHLDLPVQDPNFHGEGLAADFYNANTKTQLTPWTNPNSNQLNNGPRTGVALINITSSGNDMSFEVNYGLTSGVITADSRWNGPESCLLTQSYPNPFSLSSGAVAHIRFDLPERASVEMTIFDLQGKTVRTLASRQDFERGNTELVWDGKNDNGQTVSSGIYLYCLQAIGLASRKHFADSRKLTVVR